MASLAWGGHSNGRIPESALMRVPWQRYHFLRADACVALIEVNRRYRIEFGEDIFVTDAYREYAVQEKIFRERYVRGVPQGTGDARWWLGAFWYRRQGTASASVPGGSSHGWALAGDFGGGINDERTPRHAWMRREANKLGWVHPSWAHDNIPTNGSEEPWHFEFARAYVPTTRPPASQPATPPTTEEDEDMVTQQDREQIAGDAARAVAAALSPTLTNLAASVASAHHTAAQAVNVGHEAANAAALAARTAGEAVTLAEQIAELVRDDTGSALIVARIADLRARLPRTSAAQYGRPGVATYGELGERAATTGAQYVNLSGSTDGVAVTLDGQQVDAIVMGVTAGIEPAPAPSADEIATNLGERLARALP